MNTVNWKNNNMAKRSFEAYEHVSKVVHLSPNTKIYRVVQWLICTVGSRDTAGGQGPRNCR